MRIPPYYQKPSWQRFFAGVSVGALISWFVFLFLFGKLQEEQVKSLSTQKKQIEQLTFEKNVLIEEYEKLNEENKTKLRIQEFKIEFMNYKKYNLGGLILHTLKDEVIKDLNHLITKDIETVSKNKELLRKAIENKVYEIDDKTYKLQVYAIYFDTTLEVTLKIELIK
ncbi:hypothetical protein LCL95_14960 [Bacillus timonensis]|nr:hypothetical protein [Bacillus timonensis]